METLDLYLCFGIVSYASRRLLSVFVGTVLWLQSQGFAKGLPDEWKTVHMRANMHGVNEFIEGK
jgi:hypothetical protein